MKIKSQRDFFSGLMFLAVGIAFAVGAKNFRIGEAARMGPGYFPLMLGVVLAALGGFIVFQSLVIETEDGEPVGPWAWKPLGFVLAGNVLFGALVAGVPRIGLPSMGLVAAIVALIVTSSLASDSFRIKEVAILSFVLAAGSWLAFGFVLKLPLPLWPAFFG